MIKACGSLCYQYIKPFLNIRSYLTRFKEFLKGSCQELLDLPIHLIYCVCSSQQDTDYLRD